MAVKKKAPKVSNGNSSNDSDSSSTLSSIDYDDLNNLYTPNTNSDRKRKRKENEGSKFKQYLERRLKKDFLTLSEYQREQLRIALGPAEIRCKTRYFNKQGQLRAQEYEHYLHLQDSTGAYLVNDDVAREVFDKNERPSSPIFRSVDNSNIKFKRLEVEKYATIVNSDVDIHDSNLRRPQKSRLPDLPARVSSSPASINISSLPVLTDHSNFQQENGSKPEDRLHPNFFAQNFPHLSQQAATTELYKIESFTNTYFMMKLMPQKPCAYKPFIEDPDLRMYASAQLLQVQTMRNMLNTPEDMCLVERLENLGLEHTSFPLVMEMVMNFLIYQRLSKQLFFPDNHDILRYYKTISSKHMYGLCKLLKN